MSKIAPIMVDEMQSPWKHSQTFHLHSMCHKELFHLAISNHSIKLKSKSPGKAQKSIKSEIGRVRQFFCQRRNFYPRQFLSKTKKILRQKSKNGIFA